MSTLKTNHCDWLKNIRREMTLNEFVRQLPISHCARKEFKALQAKIARLKSDLTGTAFALSDYSAENIQLKEEIARLKLLSVRCCRCNSKIKVSQATDCPVCKQKQSDISISDQMDNSYGRF